MSHLSKSKKTCKNLINLLRFKRIILVKNCILIFSPLPQSLSMSSMKFNQLTYVGYLVYVVCLVPSCRSPSEPSAQQQLSRIQQVAGTSGLVAFWDFTHQQGQVWHSHYDTAVSEQSFPVFLRRIGDSLNYSPATWPYEDTTSVLRYDHNGPFGQAVRFNRGFLYGAVPRHLFDQTALDLHGKNPFTLIAWVKFVGKRHMVAGIWDEGGWHKYAGRRQVALFGGLFGQKGAIAHISATGASSYPQSTINGAQYARRRAIDGQPFEDNEWVAMAMTYDPAQGEVKAWLNGKMTPLSLTDPVEQDVYRYPAEHQTNPYRFESPIYSPRAFVLKYNGYDLEKEGISEHRLAVDLNLKQLRYLQGRGEEFDRQMRYRILFDLQRSGESILDQPLLFEAVSGQSQGLPLEIDIQQGDLVITSLERWENETWNQVGTRPERSIPEGAPFTFGRALGLASEEPEHGSELFLDGVAVFNRVLIEEELEVMSFVGVD
jgi:hypothetical protein